MVKSIYICVNQTSTMKLRSGKATPLGKRSMMKLRSGSIVGHKRVAPPASKIIQGPSGRVKMLERRAKDGGTEWVCEMCKPGVGGGRCEIESCADRDAGPANRPGVSERHSEKIARQAEEERRQSSSDDNNSESSEVPSEALDAFYGEDWRNRDDDEIISESDVPSEAFAPMYDSDYGDRGM